VQFAGVTGPIAISGTATTTVNLYGISSSLADTSSGTTVNDKSSSRSNMNGGDWALDTDSNGRLRLVSGTGAGEISLSSGVASANVTQIAGSTTVDTVALLDAGKILLAAADGEIAGSETGGVVTEVFKDRAGTATVTTHTTSSTGRVRS
jgi:hypothetical protein